MAEYPTTENHDFARPKPGTLRDNWGSVINRDLIDLLEQRVSITDYDNRRTEYEPYDNALFFAQDTGIWYVGNGEVWNQVGSIDDSTIGALRVKDSINKRVQAWDGDILKTELSHDDPVEIELCDEIDVSALAPIVLGSNKRVVNKGGKRGNPIVNNSTNDTFQMDNTRDIEFVGVDFTGNHSCPYHFGVAATDQSETREITFERCYFTGYDIAGYRMAGQWRVKFSNTQFQGHIQGDHGIHVENRPGDIGLNQLRITNESAIFEHASHGVYIQEIGGFTMQASTCEHNRGAGIYIPDNGSLGGFDVTSCFFEANDTGLYCGAGRINITGGKWFKQDANGTLSTSEYGPHIELGPNSWANISGIQCQVNENNPAIVSHFASGPHTFISCYDNGDGVDLNHETGTVIDCTFDAPGLTIDNGRVHYDAAEDVTAISDPTDGMSAFHDGSGDLARGPAVYDGQAHQWISMV